MLNCSRTLKECTRLPRQWCSWGPYKFWVFQHHTCSPNWPYRNYYSGRRSCSEKVRQNATTIKLLNWKWLMRNDMSLPSPSWWVKKGKQSLARLLLDLVCVCSHGLSKVWFKITGKQIPSHAYSVGNIYIHLCKNKSLQKNLFFFS